MKDRLVAYLGPTGKEKPGFSNTGKVVVLSRPKQDGGQATSGGVLCVAGGLRSANVVVAATEACPRAPSVSVGLVLALIYSYWSR